MSDHIRQIQADLKQAGFYTGEIDGIAGKQTMEAVTQAMACSKCTLKVERAVRELYASDPENVETQKAAATKANNFVFSETSLKRLHGVNDRIVRVVKLALRKSKQDFAVLEGLRTKERQMELIKKNASQTMNSKHLTGHAVDLVPIVNGAVSWDWKYYYPIAEAMREAAKELRINVRWGGAWQTLNNSSLPATKIVENYVAAKRKQGKKAFTDGPHFELA